MRPPPPAAVRALDPETDSVPDAPAAPESVDHDAEIARLIVALRDAGMGAEPTEQGDRFAVPRRTFDDEQGDDRLPSPGL